MPPGVKPQRRKRRILTSLISMALYLFCRRIRTLISRIFMDKEKESLFNQVERLKTQLKSALEHIASQDQNVAELSTKLESEIKENKTLWDQVEYLTTELNRERIYREKHLCHREKAEFQDAHNVRNHLNKQLEEMQKQLVEQERQQEELERQGMETYLKLEMKMAQYSELKQACKNLKQIHEETDQRQNAEIATEKQRNTMLQQKLQEAEGIISEQNTILDQVKQEIKLLQQKHHEQTANTSQLAESLEATEKLSHAHQHKTPQLKQTLPDLAEESPIDSLPQEHEEDDSTCTQVPKSGPE